MQTLTIANPFKDTDRKAIHVNKISLSLQRGL